MAKMVEVVLTCAPGKSITLPSSANLGFRQILPGMIVRPDEPEKYGLEAKDIQGFVEEGRLIEVPLTQLNDVPNMAHTPPVAPVPATTEENEHGQVQKGMGESKATGSSQKPKAQASMPFSYDPAALNTQVEAGNLNLEKLNTMIKAVDPAADPAADVAGAISVLSKNYNPAQA